MKRINKRIFCTLTLISSTFLPYLTINAKGTTNIPRAKTWTEDSGNLSDGNGSFMFEDKKGNLWSAGRGTPLQKYDYDNSRWETSKAIRGNLKNGWSGFMFEDRRGNLWSAGYGTPLQRYDYGTSRWETSEAISGNLKSGYGGFMFEDKKGNLWSAGGGTPLQRYNYKSNSWESNAKISGNLKSGYGGFMFQDKEGNLWSAGHGAPLQKYDYTENKWKTSPAISGNLRNGQGGFMFEDKRGNLWSAGHGTPLQKYDYTENKWKTNPEIAEHLSEGQDGFMFQDKEGNLWSAGWVTPLQRYNYDNDKWETGDKISGNLKLGYGGFMFEDKRGNLWSAGWISPLQRYDYDKDKWETGDKISGNLKLGYGGFMFEDKRGNLWSIGHQSPLQVMYSDKDVSSVIALIQANTGMIKDTTNAILPILTSSNTPFDAAALNSLGTGGTFPGDTRGTTLTYAHGGITNDGALDVTVTIVKGAARARATFTVDVAGIDAVKKDKIQKINLQTLKTQLTGGIATQAADKVKVIAARINNAASLKTETDIDLTKLVTTSTYVISASGDKDTGVITISVIMTTNGATAPKSPPVTHTINHKSDATIETEVQNSLNKVDVDNVKALIEAISGVKKTSNVDILPVVANPSFNAAALNSLGTGGTFPGDTRGTTLTYAHGGITNDGALDVTVTIVKGAARARATFTVDVAGIDAAKKDKIQEINLQALKMQLTGGAATNDANKARVIAARINDAPSLKAETGIDLSGLDTTSTYVISASGDKDTGVITISVIMTTNGATDPKSPPVTHTINHKSDATIDTEVQNSLNKVDVDNVKALIEAISGVKKTSNVDILPVVANPSFNAAALNSLGTGGTFPGDTRGTTLTYAHGGITNDGALDVTVTIVKGAARARATFTVDVAGIDAAKKDKIQKINLQTLKTQLTGGIATQAADKVKVIAARINDAPSLKAETGIDLTKLDTTSTYVISASGDKDTGVITISVIMTTNGATAPKSPPVTHTINHKSDATIETEVQNSLNKVDVDNVKALIEAISGVKKTSNVDILPVVANPSFNAAALNSLGTGGTFPGDTRGTTLTYAHGGITNDGALDVTVTIVKGAARARATFIVDVAGIDAAKKDKIQKINLQTLKTQLTGGIATQAADKVKVIAARINNAAYLKTETDIDLTKLVTTSTYVISASGDKDTGVITISVIMTTNGATVPKSPPVTHTINHKSDATIETEVQNSLNKVDVDNVKALIEAIFGVKKTSNVDILPVVANPSFNAAALNSLGTSGTFPGDTRGTTLTYAHGGITNDGDLTVTVAITKGRASAFANFNIAISGIDLAKTKVQKKANKFGDFSSTDSVNSRAAILPLNVENVKTQFEAITGYKAPNLTNGYSISKVIVKTALDANTKKVVYTITISDTNSNIATKDIVVTFAVKAISKDKGLSGGAIASIIIASILGIGILGFLIHYFLKKIKKTKIKH